MNSIRSILILIIFIPAVTTAIAQNNNNIDDKAIETEVEELQRLREDLLNEKTSLKEEIEDYNSIISKLNDELKVVFPPCMEKKYGRKDGARIAMGQIWKGMTEEMMRDSWGWPDKTNTDRYSYGVFTQYYYGKVIYFFRDGKLIDWEEEE